MEFVILCTIPGMNQDMNHSRNSNMGFNMVELYIMSDSSIFTTLESCIPVSWALFTTTDTRWPRVEFA